MKLFSKPNSLNGKEWHYCSGCGHGIIHRLVAEVIDEIEERENTVMVAPVGCAVIAYEYFNFDVTEAPHGRAPAIATGLKRVLPDRLIFTYQGDGDLAAIGTSEVIHAANRGENLTVIFVNNAIYGMTNGQMAPTSLLSQKTETTPLGRDADRDGFPIRITEMLKILPGVKFLARTSVATPQDVSKTKKAIKDAFEIQKKKLGFALVEILSMCPTCWKMPPRDALDWIKNNMVPYYPLGRIKEVEEDNSKKK